MSDKGILSRAVPRITLDEAKADMINHPPHYTFGKYEVLDVLMDWFPTSPLLWQIVKYIARARHKGTYVEDLKKAKFYLDKAIREYENKR